MVYDQLESHENFMSSWFVSGLWRKVNWEVFFLYSYSESEHKLTLSSVINTQMCENKANLHLPIAIFIRIESSIVCYDLQIPRQTRNLFHHSNNYLSFHHVLCTFICCPIDDPSVLLTARVYYWPRGRLVLSYWRPECTTDHRDDYTENCC